MAKNQKSILICVNALVFDRKDKLIFCIKRSDKDKIFPGMYSLPGGWINEGESIEDAIRREFLEETGYELLDPSEVKIETRADIGWIVLQVVVVEGTLGKKVTNRVDGDISEVKWIKIEDFLQSLHEHHYPESEIQKFRAYLNKIQ